jgi:hypothetical protein
LKSGHEAVANRGQHVLQGMAELVEERGHLLKAHQRRRVVQAGR